jgi:hypothetical protein
MTNDEIEAHIVKPSQHWVDTAGSGNFWRIVLEVLGCDGLPNLDTGGFLGNKTDAFVSVVYEDDCLSPRRMPWTNSAFILKIVQHSSSKIFIGVFDFDAGAMDDHDLIGRVSIDLTNLRKDTGYILSYNIYPGARLTRTGDAGRKSLGKVTVRRLRLEIPDERKLVLCARERQETKGFPRLTINVHWQIRCREVQSQHVEIVSVSCQLCCRPTRVRLIHPAVL